MTERTNDQGGGELARFEPPGDKAELEEGDRFTPRFDNDGLIGAVVTDAASGLVLMFAYMNAEALDRTLRTGEAHFYSRSRRRLWHKGEESGNVLKVKSLRTDCDQDMLWLTAETAGRGAACHTGRQSCFYREVLRDPDGRVRLASVGGDPMFDPATVYDDKSR